MTVYEIPLTGGTPSTQTVELIQLDGSTFTCQLSAHWCAPLGVWVLDIEDGFGNPLVHGVPMVTGANLLEQYWYLGFGGALVVQSDFDWTVPPTFDSLGKTGHLFWIPLGLPPSGPPPFPLSPEDWRNPALPTEPPPVPPPLAVAPACVNAMQWTSTASVGGSGPSASAFGTGFDQYGNYLGVNGQIFNASTGALNHRFVDTDFVNGVNAWVGAPVVDYTPSGTTGIALWPLLGGQYLFAYLSATYPYGPATFAKWFALLTPSSGGPPTVVGAVWYSNLTGLSYGGNTPQPFLANNQTADDPILVTGNYGLGGTATGFAPLPSINQIISGVYNGAGNPYFPTHPCQVPYLLWPYFGTANLCTNLYNNDRQPSFNNNAIFVLPGPGGGTNIYVYFSRAYMDSCAGPASVTKCIEVNSVLQPAYPLGCIVRVNVGVIPNFDTLYHSSSGGSLGPMPMYTVDNADWQDPAGAAAIPFLDEYVRLTDGSAGIDGYQVQPAALIKLASGHWFIVWVMSGAEDSTINRGSTTELARMRLMIYDPSTQIAKEFAVITCQAWTNPPFTWSGHYPQDYSTFARIVGEDLILGGASNAIAYQTDFATHITVS